MIGYCLQNLCTEIESLPASLKQKVDGNLRKELRPFTHTKYGVNLHETVKEL